MPSRYQSTFWPCVISSPWRLPYSLPLIPSIGVNTEITTHSHHHTTETEVKLQTWKPELLLPLYAFLWSEEEQYFLPWFAYLHVRATTWYELFYVCLCVCIGLTYVLCILLCFTVYILLSQVPFSICLFYIAPLFMFGSLCLPVHLFLSLTVH